ncbi:unnamed protein product [Durusdinium trenchii]|uniref:IMP dehydrogenase/GMP reductase domain-containing protein n=1 Tax=Durusdinium trenchii TaxID=1381693 RepID=A0ABP0PJW8_9DINO
MVAAAVSPNEPNAWDRVQASGAALRRAGGGRSMGGAANRPGGRGIPQVTLISKGLGPALVGAGADLLSLETDEGVDHYVISFLKRTKEAFPGLDVVAGPVNSVRQASMLCNHGADAIRVGLAEGASASVLYDVSRTLRANYGTPVLADLQASNSGELLKALLLGASTVSVDAMVSRCEEVPGDLIFREGVRVKLETSGSEDSAAVAMGVATHKIDGGSALSYIPIILNQLRRGLQDLGVSALAETSKALDQGLLRLERQLPRVVSFQAPKMYPITVNALHYT